MSSDAISGVSSVGLSGLAASRGISVKELVAQTQNARLSSGLNVAQLIIQQRETIQKASVESLLNPAQASKFRQVTNNLAASRASISHLNSFNSQLNDVRSLAQSILKNGKSGPFGGSRFLSSNDNAVGASGTNDAQSGTSVQVTVIQLADAAKGQKAIFKIGDKTLNSDSNTVGSDVTGLTGVTLNLKQVTQTTQTTQVVDLKDVGAIQGFDKKEDVVNLSQAAADAIQGSNIAEVQFNKGAATLGLAGLASDKTFFIKRENPNAKANSQEGREFQVFATLADAQKGTNALDLVDVVGGQIDTATNATKDVRSQLNKLTPGKDNLVQGFGQAQQGLDSILKNLQGLSPSFDNNVNDLNGAITQVQNASQQLSDATDAVNGRANANDAFNTINNVVKDFQQRLKNGENLDANQVISALTPGLDKLQKEFGNNPVGSDKDVQKALQNVLNVFGDLKTDAPNAGTKKGASDFKSDVTSLANKLNDLGDKFQSTANQADNKAINAANDTLDSVLKRLNDIGNDRGNGNTITTAGIDVSTVTRSTKTVVNDNAVTVQVLQDPATARKAIEALAKKVSDTINFVQSNSDLNKDLNVSKIAAGLRRAFQPIIGATGGGITTDSTGNTITTNADQLDTNLANESVFRQAESATLGGGGAALKLITLANNAGNVLESDVAGRLRDQKQLESQISKFTAQAEETRQSLLAGLKDVGSAALANAGTQSTSRATPSAQNKVAQPGQSRTTNQLTKTINSGLQNQQGLLQGLTSLSTATTNTIASRTALQGFLSRLG